MTQDGGLFDQLKERVDDTNKNLARQAIALVAQLAKAMGPPVKAYAKKIGQPLLDRLEDAKVQIKQEAETTIGAFVSVAGLQCIMSYLDKAIAKGGRKEVLGIILNALKQGPQPHEGPKFTIPPEVTAAVAVALTDKNAATRTLAEEALAHIVAIVGPNPARDGIKELPKAQQIAASPLVERAINEGATIRANAKAARNAESKSAESKDDEADTQDDGTETTTSPSIATIPLTSANPLGNTMSTGGPKRAATARSSSVAQLGGGTTTNANTSAGSMTSRRPGTKGSAANDNKDGLAMHAGAVSATATAGGDDAVVIGCDRKQRQARITREHKRGRGMTHRDMDEVEVEEMKDDLKKAVSPTMFGSLMSKDFKVYSDALVVLQVS